VAGITNEPANCIIDDFFVDRYRLAESSDPNNPVKVSDLVSNGVLYNVSTAPFATQLVYVNGYMEIDLPDYYFSEGPGGNSRIVMDSGSKITLTKEAGTNIPAHLHLTANISGCETLWNTIEVQKKATLSVYDSDIRDAYRAVTAKDKSYINLNNSVFRNNHVGLYVPADNPQQTIYYNDLNGVTFKRTGLLKPAYMAGLNTTVFPYAGMELNNVIGMDISGTISPQTLVRNEFNGLRNGIVAYNSTITVSHTYFKDIAAWFFPQNPLPPEDPEMGNAIICTKGDYLTVTGEGSEGTPSFENCEKGVNTDRTRTIVKDNYMKNMGTGVRISRNKTPLLGSLVEDNRIEASVIGVDLQRNEGLIKAEVIDNIIVMDGDANSAAISINDFNNLPDGWNIQDNQIELLNAGYGILCIGRDDVIRNNTILNEDNVVPTSVGISLEGSSYAKVECNTVEGTNDNFTFTDTRAINAISTYGSVVGCNWLDDMEYGARFNGACDMTDFRGNELNQHLDGIRLELSSLIGEQKYRGNLFDGPFTNLGGNNVAGAADPFYVTASLFKVDSNEDPNYNTTVNVNGWFSDDPTHPTEPTFLCTEQVCPNGIGIYSVVNNSESEMMIANGSLPEDQYGGGVNWSAARHLYDRIHNDAETAVSIPPLEEFQSNQENTSIGRFHAIETQSGSLFQNNAMDDATTEDVIVDLMNKLQELGINYNSLATDGEITEFQTQQEELMEILAASNASSAENEAVISEELNALIPSLVEANQAVPIEKIYEKNQYEVNQIYLNHLNDAEANLTGEELARLYDIASQCPLSGGDAVFLARVMLSGTGIRYDYDDDKSCGMASDRNAQVALNTASLLLRLYPNPATDELQVEITPEKMERIAEVYNMSGVKIWENKILENGTKFTIPIQSLVNSIYLLVIKRNGIIEDSDTFTVMH
jgi:hypothetical protein